MSVPSARFGIRPAALAALLSTFVAPLAFGQVAPALQRAAANLGQQRPSTPISGTVWLQLHNKAALDAAVKAMYTPGSPTYQKFADASALKQFAPTETEVASVKQELAAHKLAVISTDPNNLSIQIKGLTSDFEAAFYTTVSQYRMKSGETVSAVTNTPALGNGATGLLRAVSGISGSVMRPYNVHPVNPDTGKQSVYTPLKAAAPSPDGVFVSPQCLYAPNTVTLTTSGGLPTATYQGLVYGANPQNTTLGTRPTCGYSPQDVYRLYGLNSVYGQGYTGKGQTVAIVDAFGSPTIQADLATFNRIYNLPQATDANFKTYTPTPVTKTDVGFAEETTLDVEWTHAIAPDANIALVLAATNSDSDLQGAVLYTIENHLANVISNSYGQSEFFSDVQTITSWDEICELAAFEGISVNFSSGDSGDMFVAEGVTDVSLPASSPYATAVGGTSVSFSPADGSTVQTGWGTNLTRLSTPTAVSDPPVVDGFLFGAGGGVSQAYKLPSYQASLNQSGRVLPDVSAIADPYTGVEIIFTSAGVQGYGVIGGTSLAAPVFSAEWALLQQRFGFPLGQAAPLVARYAGTPAITDIVAPTSQFNVQGTVVNAQGSVFYSSDALAAPETATSYLSALYHGGSGSFYDLTFGTDSSLAVTPGYDQVTGWGSLNMGAILSELGNQ